MVYRVNGNSPFPSRPNAAATGSRPHPHSCISGTSCSISATDCGIPVSNLLCNSPSSGKNTPLGQSQHPASRPQSRPQHCSARCGRRTTTQPPRCIGKCGRRTAGGATRCLLSGRACWSFIVMSAQHWLFETQSLPFTAEAKGDLLEVLLPLPPGAGNWRSHSCHWCMKQRELEVQYPALFANSTCARFNRKMACDSLLLREQG